MITHAYIDAVNLHKGIKELGWTLDYKRFRVFLRDRYNVEQAYLFMGFLHDHSSLYKERQEQGYTIIFKPTIYDGDGGVKGNCDAELVLQATRDFYEKRYGKALLVTSDGDFACLANFLQEKEALKGIVSTSKSRCSLLLKQTGARMTFLEEMQNKLKYNKKR